MRELEGKTVLVTGASSGIGLAALHTFAGNGANVIAAARRRDCCEAAIEKIRQAGGEAAYFPVDISDERSIQTLFSSIRENYGSLDGAFNNAGIESDPSALPDTATQIFDSVVGTNARGTWLCMKEEMEIMRRQKSGAIVNTSSLAGLVGLPQASAYVASKHAVVGMTKSAALEVAASGVRVNCICPGATRSEMSKRWSQRYPDGEKALAGLVPIGRIADPEEPAELASFLISDRSRYIIGACIPIDGGSSVP